MKNAKTRDGDGGTASVFHTGVLRPVFMSCTAAFAAMNSGKFRKPAGDCKRRSRQVRKRVASYKKTNYLIRLAAGISSVQITKLGTAIPQVAITENR